MPIPKCLKFLPCFPKKRSPNDDDPNNSDNIVTSDGRSVFSRKQIAKAVAIVLSGYDTEIAAASVGGACSPELIDLWVTQFRPPFFEDGMRCPPALIDWWMQEKLRKEAEYATAILTSDYSVTSSMKQEPYNGVDQVC